jgi:hypothetical protein
MPKTTPNPSPSRDILRGMGAGLFKGPERITILKDLGRPSLEIYGLLPYEARPSPFEQAQLTSLFGFREVAAPRQGHQERPVLILR